MNIFISYSSIEYNKVIEIHNVLEKNGFDCWMAHQSIPAGSDYGAEIPPAIKKCDAFLLVLSQASQESIWVPKELDIAITERKFIIPFHIDNSDITEPFNFRLTNIQRIETFNKVSEGYRRLIEKLHSAESFGGETKKNGTSMTIDIETEENVLPNYREVYSAELQLSSMELVAEKIARRLINGECFRLELDMQILPIINRIISNRYQYNIEVRNGMVKVSKGSFIIGGENRTRENPVRIEPVPYDYWIDEKPVTVAEYRKYIEDAGEVNNYGHPMEPVGKSHYPAPDVSYGITGPKLYTDYLSSTKFDNHPVTFVDWWDAYSYAKWAGKDLPMEIEWEKAARGIDGRIYPYGNEYSSLSCNTDESHVGDLTEVDSYPSGVSPFGCYDMSGNVWEWCFDDYDENRRGKLKVVKGGSFRRGQNKAMTFSCNPREPSERWVARGFRCVRRIDTDEE